MTAEERVFLALSGLLGGRVFPEHLPVGAALPSLVYRRAGGVDISTNCESGWQPEMELALFCETPRQRAELWSQIQAVAFHEEWLPENALIFEYDYDTKAHCAVVSFLIDEF